MTAFEALLAVQDRDTELDQLRHRRASLAQRADLDATRKALEELEIQAADWASERAELERRRVSLDREVAGLEARLTELDRRMRSGEVTATRELTAMVDQSDSLKRRRADLEDAELEAMVALEPIDVMLSELEGRRGGLRDDERSLSAALAEAETAIDAELDAVTRARETASAGVPESLIRTYERLRTRLGGVGAARLVGASCGGCHLTLPATELDRIRREPPEALISCDHCGRILVR